MMTQIMGKNDSEVFRSPLSLLLRILKMENYKKKIPINCSNRQWLL